MKDYFSTYGTVCPFDYVTHDEWVAKATKWQKEHPESHKEAMRKYAQKKRRQNET